MSHYSLSKEDYHKFLEVINSSPDASDGRDHQQFMFLHDWKVGPPPPHTHTQQKRLPLINDFSSIAGELIHVQPENFQWQHNNILFAAICILGFVFILFSQVEFHIKATNQ